MDPKDASRTLGEQVQTIPISIPGWRRDWNVASSRRYSCTHCKGIVSGQPVALDLIEDKDAKLTATLIGVNSEHLALLDQREDSYQRVPFHPRSIFMWNSGPMPVGRFWLYQARPETRIDTEQPPPGLFVPAPYQNLVLHAAQSWGEDFKKAVEEEMIQPHWSTKEGLGFLHAPEGVDSCTC